MDNFHTNVEKQQFPWRGKFKAKQEIDDYFSGNKVQCLLCGKWFKVFFPTFYCGFMIPQTILILGRKYSYETS